MTKKRNKFLTVLFSLIPGAGHMFMGFMKQGVSVMALFFLIILFSSWLGIGPLLYALPVLWFYAFFSSINLAWADEQQFAEAEDRYLIKTEYLSQVNKKLSGRGRLYCGILLLVFGLYLIFSRLISNFYFVLQPQISELFFNVLNIFPQLFLGTVIIIVGVRLIVGKRKELKKHD